MEFPVSERTLLLWVVQLHVEIERGFTRRNLVSFSSSSFTRLPGPHVPREPQEDLFLLGPLITGVLWINRRAEF